MNPVLLLVGLGLGGAAVALYVSRSDKQTELPAAVATPPAVAPSQPFRPAITGPIWTPLTSDGIHALLRTACGCVEARPLLDDLDLAHCVWAAHWPTIVYPERAVAGDHPTVAEALAGVQQAIRAARANQCASLALDDDADGPPEPPPHPEPPKLGTSPQAQLPKLPQAELPEAELPPVLEPKLGASLGPLMATPVSKPATFTTTAALPVDVAALMRPIPTPGYLYQVRSTDNFFGDQGLLARALYQAVLLAATTKLWAPAKAQAHAKVLAADSKARLAYLGIVQCSPWNDAMYGTWAYGISDAPAAHGRAIRLIPRHDRVAERLAKGLPPIRTLDRGIPADKGTGKATGAGDQYELLWLPPLRADALLDPTRVRQVVAEGLAWPDGSSKYNPPPSVQALGITNAPAGPWGCLEDVA